MSIRVLIVDDEPLARRSIRRFLQDDSEIDIAAECADGRSAVAAILGDSPDLVFLDVQMPEMDGFEVVDRVGAQKMPFIIFVTAYDQYALRAFDTNAVDYLLKPFGGGRFARALARAKERIAARSNREESRRILAALAQIRAQKDYRERLPIHENGRIVFLKTSEIDWIEAEGNYARLHAGARNYQIRETLSNLERMLDPRRFLRIHRSTIVNAQRIKEVQPWFRGYHLVLLENGQQLRMSRYQRDVAERLGLC